MNLTRKILIGAMLTGLAGTPALADDNGRWQHKQRYAPQHSQQHPQHHAQRHAQKHAGGHRDRGRHRGHVRHEIRHHYDGRISGRNYRQHGNTILLFDNHHRLVRRIPVGHDGYWNIRGGRILVHHRGRVDVYGGRYFGLIRSYHKKRRHQGHGHGKHDAGLHISLQF